MDLAALATPVYLVDLGALAANGSVLADVKVRSGARILLALKAFALWPVFPRLAGVLDGCCASGVYEARLAREEFGGEVHAYGAAFSEEDMRQLMTLADHVGFNSTAQLAAGVKLRTAAAGGPARRPAFSLRVNPECSTQAHAMYDPCAPRSRLGVRREALRPEAVRELDGLQFHTLCEQDADALAVTLKAFDARFGDLLAQMTWVNFGGGHHITRPGYNLELLIRLVRDVSSRYGVQVYLEPGEAVVLNAGVLITRVLDVVHNELDIAILDSSCTCHMPDVLEMPYRPAVFRATQWQGCRTVAEDAEYGRSMNEEGHPVRLAGPSCLAGDCIGEYRFDRPLRPGDLLVFEDMAHYTMVKTTTFNGIKLPDIGLYDADTDQVEVIRRFGYEEFKHRLG